MLEVDINRLRGEMGKVAHECDQALTAPAKAALLAVCSIKDALNSVVKYVYNLSSLFTSRLMRSMK